MHIVDIIALMSSILSGCSMIQNFNTCSDALKRRNGIIFRSYLELPHILCNECVYMRHLILKFCLSER